MSGHCFASSDWQQSLQVTELLHAICAEIACCCTHSDDALDVPLLLLLLL
jgi:hypothetical protein